MFPFKVVLTDQQAKKHWEEATKEAGRFLELAETVQKPYDACLGMYLAIASICKQYGWNPSDFHQWVSKDFPERIIPVHIG